MRESPSLDDVKLIPSTPFLILVFLASWSVEIPAALSAYGLWNVKVSGGLQTVAQLAPAASALTVLALSNRRTQLRLLLRSATKWRVGAKWYIAVVLFPFLTQGLAVWGYHSLGHALPRFDTWYVAPLLTLGLGVFSFGEEIGWRGLYLPALLETTTPLLATLRIACLWGLWHLPFYLARHVPGEKTMVVYFIFLAGMIPVASMFTFVYLRTRSVMICSLLHGALNAGAAYWFGPLTAGANAVFGVWVASLWVVSIPLMHRLHHCSGKVGRP